LIPALARLRTDSSGSAKGPNAAVWPSRVTLTDAPAPMPALGARYKQARGGQDSPIGRRVADSHTGGSLFNSDAQRMFVAAEILMPLCLGSRVGAAIRVDE
jgi:hypothetical protein